MNYAIETIGLVKRYSATVKSSIASLGGRPKPGSISSFTGVFNLLKRGQGPYIEALRGVNLKIQKGEIFGILGPNGAGKTTLIKILCTLVLHDEGEVYVNGHDPSKEPSEVLKNLQAVLPESRGFNWRLSGRQNLEFYAQLYGLPDYAARKRIDYLLDYTGLGDRADDGYQKYSTGMQRRLLLCRALIRDTPIIVFDEPTAGLDPTGAVEFRDLLIDRLARQEGKTIMLSTHNLQEAQGLCGRIAILDHGQVIACDTPDNVRHLVAEKQMLKVVSSSVPYGEAQRRLLSKISQVQGVISIDPSLGKDGAMTGISISFEKGTNLALILQVLSSGGLEISSVDTVEPSLQDAFIAMTDHRKQSPHQGHTAEGT